MIESVLILDGRSLTLEGLASASSGTTVVHCDPDGLLRMNKARQLLDEAAASGEPIYGVTRGLGARCAADLTTNASLALALLGEGQMQSREGRAAPSKEMMRHCGISPLAPEGRDGLALISHSSMTIAFSALAIHRAAIVFEAAQTAAALSLEAFRSSLAPFDPRVLATKPLPGQTTAAEGLLGRLAGSRLFETGESRRLQDPLSFRNIAQIHGVTASALTHARKIVEIEMNGSSDNPAVLIDDERVVTSGSYFTAELAHAVEGLSRSFVGLGFAQLARMARHLDPDFSGLPVFLGEPGTNGFAPLMKTAEAVLAQLTHAPQPANPWPSINANGVEDCLSTAPIAVKSLDHVAVQAARLASIELVVASRAIALRAGKIELPKPLIKTADFTRSIGGSSPSEPLGERVENLACAILRAELP